MGRAQAKTVQSSRLATLCGVVDRNDAVARAVAAELAVPPFTDLSNAIEATSPDAAIVATPDPSHRLPATTAIEAGLAVLVEKPLATTIDDAEAIVALARRRGTRLMPGHILRFDSGYARAAALLRSGELGRPILAMARHWSAKSLGARVASTTSPLWHFGIHHIDAIQWAGGGLIDRIDGARRADSPTGANTFTALGTLTTGCAFQLATGWTLPEVGGRTSDLEVHCEHGVLRVARYGDSVGLAIWSESGAKRASSAVPPAAFDELLRQEVEHFVTAVREDVPFVITPEEAVDAVRSAVRLEQACVRGTLKTAVWPS